MKHIKMDSVVARSKSRPFRIESKISMAEAVFSYRLKTGQLDSCFNSLKMILNLTHKKIEQDHCS
jgi:hypothetical protein